MTGPLAGLPIGPAKSTANDTGRSTADGTAMSTARTALGTGRTTTGVPGNPDGPGRGTGGRR
ncbi:hypothetical protein ACSDR0_01675 [Streptosporangium sp. G11]|uniref:hypothetical protein n=1 Tax=Streptosporangium sp. G11 TaxID=3436926 RepID=UPI003EB7FA8B